MAKTLHKIREGISALIAEVLIMAISLAVIGVAVSWVLGLWNTTQETFMINPVIRISYGSLSPEPVLKLHIVNKGSHGDTIIRVEVKIGNGYYINESTFDIPAGFSGDIIINKWSKNGSPKQPEPGDRCRIYVYTRDHGMMFYDLLVTP